MRNALIIRLRRSRKIGARVFWLTVSRKYSHVTGKFIEKIGFLLILPNAESRFLFLNFERLGYWSLKNVKFSKKSALLLGHVHFSTIVLNFSPLLRKKNKILQKFF